MELHKQFKVPIEGLMGEEINLLPKSQKDNNKKKNIKGPYE